MALTFYCGSGSPFAWKVWLVLEHKSIPYDLKLLSFDAGDTRKPEFLAVNPRGKVPAIVDNGFALWESNAIVEYLEEAYPQVPLLPKDAKGRATVRRLMEEADNFLSPAVNALAELTLFHKGPDDPTALAKARDEVVAELERWDERLTGDYLAGALSLADFSAYPHARLLGRIEFRLPGKGIGSRTPARVAAWYKRIEALPYYEKTIPPHWKK